MLPFDKIIKNNKDDCVVYIIGYHKKGMDIKDTMDLADLTDFIGEDFKIKPEHKQEILEHLNVNENDYSWIIEKVIEPNTSNFCYIYILTSKNNQTLPLTYEEVIENIKFRGGYVELKKVRVPLDDIKSDSNLTCEEFGNGNVMISNKNVNFSDHHIVKQFEPYFNSVFETKIAHHDIAPQVWKYLETKMEFTEITNGHYIVCPRNPTNAQVMQRDSYIEQNMKRISRINKLNKMFETIVPED